MEICPKAEATEEIESVAWDRS